MDNLTSKSEKDFRPSFYSNSFDSSLRKLNRTEFIFDFLCTKEAPLSVKKILNQIETYAVHTHHGLYSTKGCILISDLVFKVLKDEKTVKSYIKDTIKFFNENPIALSSKLNEINDDSPEVFQEYPFFDTLEIVKTEHGLALSYSYSCAVSQLTKTELNKNHFLKLYAKKHKINNFKEIEPLCSDFLYSILKVGNCVPHDLMNRVFSLPPQELLLLQKQQLTSFTDTEYQVLKDANTRYLKSSSNEGKRQFVSMPSWIDAVLTKNSESNLYYYCLSKLTKHIKNKATKNKQTCKFQIRVGNLRLLLQRVSKNYDNYAINKYLQEVAALLTQKTDLKIGVGHTAKGKGSLLSFQIIVVKKTKVEVEAARLGALSDVKVKKVDCYTIKYHQELQRKFKTNALFCLDENGAIQQIEYVLFDDLIKNPKLEVQVDKESQSGAENASFAPTAPKAISSNGNDALPPNKANNEQLEGDKEVRVQVLKLKTLSYQQPYFDQSNDSVRIPLGVIDDIENISFKSSVFDANHKEQALNNDHLIEMKGSDIFVKRAIFIDLFRLSSKKNTLSVNIYYKNNALKSYRFDANFIVRLLSKSVGVDYSSLLDKAFTVCQNTITCKSTVKNSRQLKLLIQSPQRGETINFTLSEVKRGLALFSQKTDKDHQLEIDWFFIFNVMQYAAIHDTQVKVQIRSSVSEEEMMLTDFIGMLTNG